MFDNSGLKGVKPDETLQGFCHEIYVLPMNYLEQAKASMNFTSDENDEPKYLHVVLYKNETGKKIHSLSRPTLKEVELDHYKL